MTKDQLLEYLKKEEAKAYLDEDRQTLLNAAATAGVALDLDENGLITNYTETMTALWEQLDAEIEKANRDGNASESETRPIIYPITEGGSINFFTIRI